MLRERLELFNFLYDLTTYGMEKFRCMECNEYYQPTVLDLLTTVETDYQVYMHLRPEFVDGCYDNEIRANLGFLVNMWDEVRSMTIANCPICGGDVLYSSYGDYEKYMAQLLNRGNENIEKDTGKSYIVAEIGPVDSFTERGSLGDIITPRTMEY